MKPFARARIIAVIIAAILCLSAPQLWAQVLSTSHVFPQVADGRQSDGNYYNSFFFITNPTNASVGCLIQLFGMSDSRLAAPASFTISPGYWLLHGTTGADNLASGFATLSCTQPVYATLLYGLSRWNGETAGMATVFSSPMKSYAHYPVVLAKDLRFGVAIANNSALPISVKLYLTTSAGTTTKTVMIAQRGQLVGFVDQLIAVPPVSGTTPATFEIQGVNGVVFSTIGLLYSGQIFTTVVPSY